MDYENQLDRELAMAYARNDKIAKINLDLIIKLQAAESELARLRDENAELNKRIEDLGWLYAKHA